MSPAPQLASYVSTFIRSKSLANRQRHESPSPARAMPPPAKNSRYVRVAMASTDSHDEFKPDDSNAKQNSPAALRSFVDDAANFKAPTTAIVLYLFIIAA